MSDIPDPYPDDRKPSCETHGLHSPCVHDFPTNTGPDTETVPVPVALVEALRAVVKDEGGCFYEDAYHAARALVEAVGERPTAGEDEPSLIDELSAGIRNALCVCGHTRETHACTFTSQRCLCGCTEFRRAPADPVSEARCRHCGHPMSGHSDNGCTGIGGTGDPCYCAPLVACPACGHEIDSPDGCSECPPPTTPREDEPPCQMCEVAHGPASCGDVDCWHNCGAPADPVSEPRCVACGHPRRFHQWRDVQRIDCDTCDCLAFTPDPPPTTPREEYNVCKCGHREAWHNTPYQPNCTGQFGRCPCMTFEFDHTYPTPPREDLADAVRALADHYDQEDGREYPNGSVPCPEVAMRLRLILSDPPAGAATPPTTADLPTTPGSVIEAKGASGVPRLWFHRDEPRYWINDNGTIAGDSALTLVRVLFDAGERGEP